MYHVQGWHALANIFSWLCINNDIVRDVAVFLYMPIKIPFCGLNEQLKKLIIN